MNEPKATVAEYKGHPIISLPLNGDKTFSFGLRKAQAILACIAEIEAFVDSQN